MNALQIIPPRPVARVRRSAPRLRISDVILLLALVGSMSMSRGEEGIASEPDAAVVIRDSRNEAGGNDKSLAATQSASMSTATTADSGGGGSDEKAPATAQAIAPSVTPTPSGAGNDLKVGGEIGKPAVAGPKSDTAVIDAIKDRNTHEHGGSCVLARPSTISSASVASKNDPSPKQDMRVRKTASSGIAARPADSGRRIHQPRGEVGYRSWKSADGMAVRIGPPIYGPSPEAGAPYGVDLADEMKSRDRMSLPARTATAAWKRVLDAPGAVLDGGKQALYGIVDSVW